MPPDTSLERTANRQAHAWREQKVGFLRFENKRGRLADRFIWATPGGTVVRLAAYLQAACS